MSEGAELHGSVLRAVLYAIMELAKGTDGGEVLAHLTLNVAETILQFHLPLKRECRGAEDEHRAIVQQRRGISS